jgi:acetyl-CoA synthetase
MTDENQIIFPSEDFTNNANIKSKEELDQIYRHAANDPEDFWAKQAEQLDWFKKWDSVFNYTKHPFVKWFSGGKLNVSYNCLDRHLNTHRRNKAAIIWQAENENESRIITYQQLHREVCRFSNVLAKKGVKKGDRVLIYMPMIPELAVSMLACARIGAIHSIVFCGFSSEAIKSRQEDCAAKVVITSDGSYRKGKVTDVKGIVDKGIEGNKTVESVIVVRRGNNEINFVEGRDCYFDEEINAKDISNEYHPEQMDSEDSFFILYTSGTTGKPKGILHTVAGYSLYVLQTFKWIFDIKDTDTYWCTADIGWITGHSYIVYGPLLNGATTVMFEGLPNYPDAGRVWKTVEKYNVSVFYTAPTLIRSLAREGDDYPNKYDLSSLRLLGSVGEPINPEAWLWYHRVIGNNKCPIVDTWWQTETGGMMISPIPGVTPLKPGSATKPFPGIQAAIFREDGSEADVNEQGYLVIKKSWPSIGRTVWKNPERYKDTYFGKFKDVYLTGDGAKKDEDGYFWVSGRLDDIMNVSGHRLGTAEIESAIVACNKVAEAAVVPYPHDIKGQAIYAFVTLKQGVPKDKNVQKEIISKVRSEIGPIAKPDKIQFSEGLPKTRSGKIMRRILKAIAEGKDDVGNTTTLADPSVVDVLKRERIN